MKHEYRIGESRYSDGSGYFYVEIRRWYWPFWNRLEWTDCFGLIEIQIYEFVSNSFKTELEAGQFAIQYALYGRDAFIKNTNEKPKIYLGRLP